MNVRMCGPFPPEICPFPLKNGGFPTLPPVLPVYPGFSIILSPYTGKPGKAYTMKQKIRNSAVMWLYRKKGSTLSIRDFTYQFDDDTMKAIQFGLGFRPAAS